MSFSFPPIYQNYIDLWSPFSRIEPISEVYNEKVESVQKVSETPHEKLVLYNKRGFIEEYYYGNSAQSTRV